MSQSECERREREGGRGMGGEMAAEKRSITVHREPSVFYKSTANNNSA